LAPSEASKMSHSEIHSAPALADERTEIDDDLQRERKLVDATVNEIQHDIHLAPVLRRSIRELRIRLREQRRAGDHARVDARRTTDVALEQEQRSVTEDRRQIELELESAEQTVRRDRIDVRRGLSSITAEIDVIAASLHAIRMRSVDLPVERDVCELASIEGAADRVLELIDAMLDSE
jgi:hypothetical protein